MSTAYRFDGAVATVTDPAFFRNWMADADYIEQLVRAPDPDDVARKRVAVDFQRELALLIASGQVAGGIDALLAKFLTEDYRQHDPHLANGREPLAAFFKGAGAAGIDLWPPMPVCAMNSGDVVALLLQAAPEAGREKFIPTMFRIRDGRMAEHWSAALPPPPGPPPGR